MWDSDERECVLKFDQKSAPIPDEHLAPVVEAVTGICRNLFDESTCLVLGLRYEV